MNEQKWVPFYFDGNMFSKRIESAADWKELQAAYPRKTVADLLDAREATYNGTRQDIERLFHPKYGFRFECDGEPLRDFFECHGMHVEGM